MWKYIVYWITLTHGDGEKKFQSYTKVEPTVKMCIDFKTYLLRDSMTKQVWIDSFKIAK